MGSSPNLSRNFELAQVFRVLLLFLRRFLACGLALPLVARPLAPVLLAPVDREFGLAGDGAGDFPKHW